ncbi:MAG: outer membrane beta-barrel protein [Bdellovibrionota bacterium]
MRFIALLLASVLGFASSAHAEAPTKGFRYSLDVGGIAMHGDLNNQGTKVGAGFGATYQFNDRYSLELVYIGSSFEDVDHRAFDIGASWYHPDVAEDFHTSAGFSFIHNDFKLLSRSGDAAGIYLGLGMSWEVATRLRLGYDIRFHKAFPSKATIAGVEVTTVTDSTSMMFSVSYAPDLSE